MGDTTAPIPESRVDPEIPATPQWTLIVLYLAEELHRCGERQVVPWGRFVVARHGLEVNLVRLRPGMSTETSTIETSTLSRNGEFVLAPHASCIAVEKVPNNHRLFINGKQSNFELVADPVLVRVENEALFLLTKRLPEMPALKKFPFSMLGPFGKPNDVGLVGESHAFMAMLDQIATAAAIKTKAGVIIWGESGTGKTPVAKAIHKLSRYAGGPFVQESAPNLQPTIADVLLYGGVKGWLQGHEPESKGWLGAAAGGVLFLDEYGDLHRDVQAMLLHLLQERLYTPKGMNEPVPLDGLIIGATNKPLADPPLRMDLIYRHHVVWLPSLADRWEDVAILAMHFIERARAEGDDRVRSLRNLPRILEHVILNGLKGNIRELEEVVLNGLSDIDKVVPKQVAAAPAAPVEQPERPVRGKPTIGDTPQNEMRVRALLHELDGNVSGVAERMGVTRSSLREFMMRNGIVSKRRDKER